MKMFNEIKKQIRQIEAFIAYQLYAFKTQIKTQKQKTHENKRNKATEETEKQIGNNVRSRTCLWCLGNTRWNSN